MSRKRRKESIYLNDAQEKFALLVALEGMGSKDAYGIAYPNTAESSAAANGWTLSQTQKMASRIEVLRKQKDETETNARIKIMEQVETKRIMAKIADVEEREEFWSDLMRDGSERTRDRLAASELLGKRQRDFVQQVETQTLTATVDLSQFSLQDLKDILAVVKERRMLDDGTATTE
jgi:hypothetical protein